MKRRAAREIAVQMLYQIDMNNETAANVIDNVWDSIHDEEENVQHDKNAYDFISQIVYGTTKYKEQVDEMLKGFLKGWKMERLSKVDLQVLRLAVYEICVANTPEKAMINEAVELAKHFGDEDSGKFVNGVLGKVVENKSLWITKEEK
ncbi:transcription antitermination factor NusB [Longirhabdus pacifica]|uniref:transcription antitermination factor NusB n=1 Tax=Longirhabdus pacifica TaxID=2305227 RepID=UPI001008E3D9|nr:transcription antitermination factor NusB [Longirhabdus pacifica]